MFGWKKLALRAQKTARAADEQVEALTAEVREVSGANGRLAAKLTDRDITIRGLVEENATLKASLEAMAVEDAEAGVSS